jgi:inhibitor of KinA sporulation pathway (predicted exonuclease)
MIYIFVDFEMNRIDDESILQQHICKNEIIEIGAVKFDDTYQEIDSFKTYVKPVISRISDRITKLTGITNDMVEAAPEFAAAADSFISWCQDGDVIYAWSENDFKQFSGEMRLKQYTNEAASNILSMWKDFQKEFGRILGIRRRIALSDAVFYLGKDFQGEEHDALWDARNTAEVFVLSKDREMLEKVMAPIINAYKPKENMTYSLGDIFAHIKLS